jgi:hypothetical protein
MPSIAAICRIRQSAGAAARHHNIFNIFGIQFGSTPQPRRAGRAGQGEEIDLYAEIRPAQRVGDVPDLPARPGGRGRDSLRQ